MIVWKALADRRSVGDMKLPEIKKNTYVIQLWRISLLQS